MSFFSVVSLKSSLMTSSGPHLCNLLKTLPDSKTTWIDLAPFCVSVFTVSPSTDNENAKNTRTIISYITKSQSLVHGFIGGGWDGVKVLVQTHLYLVLVVLGGKETIYSARDRVEITYMQGKYLNLCNISLIQDKNLKC